MKIHIQERKVKKQAQINEPVFSGIQSFLGSLLFRVFRSGSSVGSFSRVWF